VGGRSRAADLLAATDTGPPPRVRIYFPSTTAEARGRLPARSAGAALELRGYVKSGGVRLSMRRPVLPLATWPRRGVGAGAGRSSARWPCRRSRHPISEARGKPVRVDWTLQRKTPVLPLGAEKEKENRVWEKRTKTQAERENKGSAGLPVCLCGEGIERE
jgi:hypothetical protein